MSLNKKLVTLESFFKNLILNNKIKAAESLSSYFVLEEGMNKQTYLEHEFKLFQSISDHFDLNEQFHIHVNSMKKNMLDITLLNEQYEFVYDWCYFFDENDKIIGNGSELQTVSKLQFFEGEIWRSIAISITNPKSIHSIIQKNQNIERYSIENNEVTIDQTFLNYNFSLIDDDFNDKTTNLYLLGNKFKENKEIILRGLNRVYIEFKENYPILNENELFIRDNKHLWSLAVFFEDNSNVYITFPKDNQYQFNKKIKYAVLTDQYDFDWITGYNIKKDSFFN